ncbi:hypothetical protein E2562_017409 [Oryza meyeriana var. granulata]|uniref:Uncharacterized protein n=1 Tax=Oryza meyeriana var. granulata TaxID=110450 RepID=A0A6G1D559_9ORYZ|nr:hypothetical protein E2562_017409 [Oryza meyeriana var. granulata]KAF0907479.1 hypothetical protein E2562_017409 [Oryza meyeriana var. granulata]KAF0907480.1 hypothetical protein E2562_017409 [Oryza meyeriana var. granulata]
MDGQQQHSSDSPAATGVGMPHLFHALGPALLISIGYIDLGKWVAAVEAGSRFGVDLVLLALLFNFMAILCQFLAACIGTVTGRSLAEVLDVLPDLFVSWFCSGLTPLQSTLVVVSQRYMMV